MCPLHVGSSSGGLPHRHYRRRFGFVLACFSDWKWQSRTFVGYRISDIGYWILDIGYWILDDDAIEPKDRKIFLGMMTCKYGHPNVT